MLIYKAIGIMSGTSLDGLDIALCRLTLQNNVLWNYEILKAKTIPYNEYWRNRLSNAHLLNALEFIKLHKEYGKFIAQNIIEYANDDLNEVDFIASHGHTIFHEPAKNITFQLGDGATIAATTMKTVVSDFRSFDVALEGQGAPLVPIGDALLFAEYDYCLNLGGFANISFDTNNKRTAYDICPVNFALNYLSQQIGYEYDKDGELGSKGNVNDKLLAQLNALDFYKKKPPKSLSREWFETEVKPLFDNCNESQSSKLRTAYEHISNQISRSIDSSEKKKMLITGGGAKNKFLVELLKNKTQTIIVKPNVTIIDFKEALIFALLGVLRIQNKINCLASVTGAKYDNIGGVVYQVND